MELNDTGYPPLHFILAMMQGLSPVLFTTLGDAACDDCAEEGAEDGGGRPPKDQGACGPPMLTDEFRPCALQVV